MHFYVINTQNKVLINIISFLKVTTAFEKPLTVPPLYPSSFLQHSDAHEEIFSKIRPFSLKALFRKR